MNVEGLTIGVFGEVHPHLISKSDFSKISQRLLFAELNLSDILSLKKKPMHLSPIVPYPCSTRDWTVTLPSLIPYGTVHSIIQSCSPTCLESFEIIDSFSNQELGEGKKNVTFRFIYRERHQTIGSQAVEDAHCKLTHSVAKKLLDLI